MIGSTFADVLAGARQADQKAWEQVYRDLAGPLAGFFRSRGMWDADDLVGETFLHVARSLNTFSGDESQFRAWVFTIAHRRAVDAVRQAVRRPAVTLAPKDLITLVDALDGPQDQLDAVVEQLDNTGTLQALLAALTPEQAEVLVLRFGADLDATTVGVMTGRSTNAVAAITARALTRLRELLTPDPAAVT
jgi:RNA polymerase sigma-70 factor (ECF subfamily)